MATLTSDPVSFNYVKGHGGTFSVPIGAATAGQTIVIYIAGGAVPSAINLTDGSGAAFARRSPAYSGGASDTSIWDATAVGGETAVFVNLGSGDGNESGTVYSLAGGLTFSAGTHNGSGVSADKSTDFMFTPDAVTLSTGAGVLIAGFAVDTSSPFTGGNHLIGLGPYGHVYGRGGNQPGNGGNDIIWQSGLMDVTNTVAFPQQGSAGVFRATAQWLGSGNCYAAQVLYEDTSGVLTNPVVSDVVRENSLPGTDMSHWYLATATDASICGYTDKPTYRPGDTVQFMVDSTGNPFRVEIYRTGFYGFETFSARNQTGCQGGYLSGTVVTQPTPDVDATTGSTSCAWTANATWTIPADAASGQYYALARRTDDTTKVTAILFLVSGDPTGRIAVALPDFTRQAYNCWGATGDHGIRGVGGQWRGKNLYQDGGDAALADITHRSYAVDIRRPNGILDSQGSTSYTDSEQGTIAFLEAQGYDLCYLSNWDLDADPTILTKARRVIILGHHEYLTTNAYNAMNAARDAGINIMSQGANNAGWRVRFDSTDTARNSMICYKESETLDEGNNPALPGTGYDPGDTDGTPQYTGTWRDTRAISGTVNNTDPRPDNTLFGQYFIASGPVQTTLSVPAGSKHLPIWRNSAAVQALTGTSAYTTLVNALGFEADYPNGDASQPGNLVNLNPYNASFVTGANAAGSTYGDTVGPITLGFTLYLASSGALVFHTGVWRGWWGVSRWQGGGFSGNVVDANWQNALLATMYDLGERPVTLTNMQPGIDPDVVDPSVGAPGTGNTSVARAYGLKVFSSAAILFFLQ